MIIFYKAFLIFLASLFPLAVFGKTPPSLEKEETSRDSLMVIEKINIIGNNVTKDHIILRELTFTIGDTITSSQLDAKLKTSKNNLLNTSLFNFATLNPLYSTNTAEIFILLTERWYIWPFPILEYDDTNFNTWWRSKDFSRLNYGFFLNRQNFRGRKENLRVKFQLGYTQELGLQYEIPFINKNQTQGMGFTVSYQRRHQIVHSTSDNKRLFYTSPKDHARTELFVNSYYQIRKKLYNRHTFQMQYTRAEVLDTVVDLNRYYFSEQTNQTQFLTLAYQFRRDKRDSKSYPLKGYFFEFELIKPGLGITNKNLNLLTGEFSFKRYWQPGRKLFFSASTKLRATNKTQPYYLRNGLGYNEHDFVRGYEYYVVDGQNFILGKTQLRYQLLSPKVLDAPFIPWHQFNKIPIAAYLGIYGDAGYVESRYKSFNPLSNELLYGAGVSLDFVTYYDLVFRTEYSLNKFGEHGLFFHFVAPI